MIANKLAQWWRPEAPTDRLSGTLFEDEAAPSGIRLLVDGHFGVTSAPSPPEGVPLAVRLTLDDVPLLLGITADGKFLSLIDCRAVNASGLPGLTKTFQVFRPAIIVYDIHFASVEDFRLISLSGRFSNLDQWVNTGGIAYSFPTGGVYKIAVTYTKPEPVEATLSNGISVKVDFSVSGPNLADRNEANIRQNAWLSVSSSQARSYLELLRALTVLADFVSLGIGKAIRIEECRAGVFNPESTESPQEKIYFRLQHNSDPVAPVRKDVDSSRMLFTLEDLREDFGKILEAWCVQHERIKPLYSLYFGTLRSPSMYVEHRFLNMFQALEAFDRRDFVPAPEAKKAHQEKKRILAAVQEQEDRDWLNEKLNFSHEPSAKERLKRLVEKYEAAWIFDDPAADIKFALDLRNFYTHYDAKLACKLPEEEKQVRAMHNFAVRFQVLCEIILLREIGFPADQIKTRLQETRRLKQRLIEL